VGENEKEDPDFDDIIFEEYKPPFVRSTKKQRELLERLAAMKGLHYAALIRKCNDLIDRSPPVKIKDIGELSIREADKVIKEIGEIRK
jgi:hypothetical protein